MFGGQYLRIVIFTVFMVGLVLRPAPANALNPELRLEQLQHTAWSQKDGAPSDVWALAQSPDGFLWLGTGSGLFRFDGVKFENVPLKGRGKIKSDNITALLALPNGDLWIGYYSGGVSLLSKGRFYSNYDNVPNAPITGLIQDRSGSIWATSYNGISRYKGGHWTAFGKDLGVPSLKATSVAMAADGTLFICGWSVSEQNARSGLVLVLPPGAETFKVLRLGPKNPWSLAIAPDGRILVSGNDELYALNFNHKGQFNPYLRPGIERHRFVTLRKMRIDRDGALWGVQWTRGIVRLRADLADMKQLKHPDEANIKNGLTSDIGGITFEDREGNIWVGTNSGIDRYREPAIVASLEIPSTSKWGYRLTGGQSTGLTISTNGSLYHIKPGQRISRRDIWNSATTCLAESRSGGMWAGQGRWIERLDGSKRTRLPLPDEAGGETIAACAEDREGHLWVAIENTGVFKLTDHRWTRLARPWPEEEAPSVVVVGPRDETWISYNDKIIRILAGRISRFSQAEGLDIGKIQTILPTQTGALIGGDLGFAIYDGRTMRSLHVDQYPQFSRISGISQNNAGDIWAYGAAGLVHLRTQDLTLALAKRTTLKFHAFDFRDGLPGPAQQDSHSQTLFEATDGKLWLLSNHGVAWIDPERIPRNLISPPVVITGVQVNGTSYNHDGPVSLPPNSKTIQLDYTALSLSIPERVNFKYKLEGFDQTWVASGNRRQAFYTNLGPGKYLFRVIASNNDGVWNEVGAEKEILIQPAFYQTIWFKFACAGALAIIIYLGYRLRVEYLSGLIRQRFADRLKERERIARELHDTLLQSLQGLMLIFKSASSSIPLGHDARIAVERGLLRAEDTLAEGRNRVRELRSSIVEDDISDAFAHIAEKLGINAALRVQIIKEGRHKDLHPVVIQELLRIGEEAMFNTLRHAGADNLEIAIVYRPDALLLRVSDDGRGMDARIAEHGGLAGHFGLVGMRERAERIEARFMLASAPSSGTEIKVIVPAKIAYANRQGLWDLASSSFREFE